MTLYIYKIIVWQLQETKAIYNYLLICSFKDRKFYRIGEVWSTESERELLGRTDVYALVDTMSDESYNMRMGMQTMEAAASAILAALEKH